MRAWKFAIAGLVAVSLAGAVALLAGLDSGVGALVTATAAIAAGVLAHMIPGPSAAEVLRPTRKEAF